MNARTAKILALVLMIGAVTLVGYAIYLGAQPPVVAEGQQADQNVVIVTTRAVAAGERVDADAVAEQRVRVAPPSGFSVLEDVIGREVAVQLEAGQVLLSRDFLSPGRFHAELGSDERAIAVKVDEVIGLGGFADPGDRVDVLVYFSGRERGRKAQAQLLLEDVRVLAVGSRTEKLSEGDKSERARSAVLAVPVDVVSRLMLAANTGRLRLALRPGPSRSPEDTGRPPAKIATLDGLLSGREKSTVRPVRSRKVEIVRGDEKSWIRP